MTPRRNTKEDILQASLRLFARAGFEATGMREIAAAVGIQPASVYKHFACKQAILDALVRRLPRSHRWRTSARGCFATGPRTSSPRCSGRCSP